MLSESLRRCEDGNLKLPGVEHKTVQWQWGSSSSTKLRLRLLESIKTALYRLQHCAITICSGSKNTVISPGVGAAFLRSYGSFLL
jgi:hypothetical protein